ncbi:MAG: c-type cytochrome [Proteobacteria bacterium]|nr:c-type cytochrome [Pseudomonadota bacterium]
MMQSINLAIAVVFVACCLAAPAFADDLAIKGSAIVAEKCSRCHAVGASDESPIKVTPPFRSLGQDYPVPMLVEALETGIISGHDEMPMFDLGKDGVAAVVAYIESLDPTAPRYLKGKR